MARPTNPLPPQTIEDCRQVIADEIAKSNPNPRRSMNATTLLNSLEAERTRTDKLADTAVRQQEAEASEQASRQSETAWKEAETERIWNSANATIAKERSSINEQISTLRGEVAALKTKAQTTLAEHNTEIARLESEHQSELARQRAEINQWRAAHDALKQYDISVAERTPPETIEDCDAELAVLSARLASLSPKYQEQECAQTARRMRLLLDTRKELTALVPNEQDDARRRLEM